MTRARSITRARSGAWLIVLVAACASNGGTPNPSGAGPAGTVAAGSAGASGASASAGTSGASVGGAGASASGGGAAGETPDAGMPGVAQTAPGLNANAVLKSSCATSTVQSQLLPANILFVLDRSGSMACNPPPTTDSVACENQPVRAQANLPSKWEITTGALQAAIKNLPATASVGLSYFSIDDSCGVSSTPNVPVAQNTQAQRDAIAADIKMVSPGGGTPIVGAVILAYKHMHEAALGGQIFGNEFVVLITDGAQSEMCSDPAYCTDAASCTTYLVNQEVPKAAGPGVGIRTFVIGVPGSEPSRVMLSQIAQQGGTAPAGCDPQQGNCHFDMTQVSDLGSSLANALMQISGKAVGCELDLPQPTDGKLDLNLVNVVYTPSDGSGSQVLRQDAHAACDAGANGWQYNADHSKILVCGSTCDVVRADAAARVDVVLGCPIQGVN